MDPNAVNAGTGATQDWLLYGANGYTGELIARECRRQGLRPVLAGRTRERIAPLAASLELPSRVFDLRDVRELATQLKGMRLVLNCAGPFSATAGPLMDACLEARVHYLDVTGEIAVFERAHALNEAARAAGIVICCGVGFDVIPTDCLAATLKASLPQATHLALGFDSRSGLSPGTAKTSLQRLAVGGAVRENGRITTVPLAWKTRRIDFGAGEKLAMSIPWGDVSTAWHTTAIPNIEVYIPASPRLIARLRWLNPLRPVLRLRPLQALAARRIEKAVKGPDGAQRARSPTCVWGEVRDERGATRTARLVVANGYDVTVSGALAITRSVLEEPRQGGAYTPALLMGADFVCTLPGSGVVRMEGD